MEWIPTNDANMNRCMDDYIEQHDLRFSTSVNCVTNILQDTKEASNPLLDNIHKHLNDLSVTMLEVISM